MLVLRHDPVPGGRVFADLLLGPRYSLDSLFNNMCVLVQVAPALVSALDRVWGDFQHPLTYNATGSVAVAAALINRQNRVQHL